MCLTYKIEYSHIKINFTYEVFISHKDLKHFHISNVIFTREITCEIFVREFNKVMRAFQSLQAYNIHSLLLSSIVGQY